MYRVLIHKTGMAKDNYTFYAITTTTPTLIDEDVQEVTLKKSTTVFETADLNVLAEEYKKLLNLYTADNIKPIDMLKVDLIADITDDTE